MWHDDVAGEIAEMFAIREGVPETSDPAFWDGMQASRRRESRDEDHASRVAHLRARDRAWERATRERLRPAEGVVSVCSKCGGRLEMREGLPRPLHIGRCAATKAA